MAVLGIQNFDRMLKRVEMMEKACGEKVRDDAMLAAGDVLARALEAATPTRTTNLNPPKRKTSWHPPGTARRSVINVSAKQKQYGVTRRLIGYSKDAFYMLFVEQGHKMVTGGRLKRAASKSQFGGRTHSQGGGGGTVGIVEGKHFMSGVFRANIGRAMEAAREVVRRAARGDASKGKAA